MSVYSSPSSDTSAGSWTPSTGSDLYALVDDTNTPDDSDYISSSGGTACVLALSTMSAPHLTRGRVSLRVRARQDGLVSGVLNVLLKSDTTEVLSWDIYAPSSFNGFVRSINADELALFTSWSSMTLTLTYTGTGVCDVSNLVLADEGVQDALGEGLDYEDMRNGGYCAKTGYWFPDRELVWVDGMRYWRQTGRRTRDDR